MLVEDVWEALLPGSAMLLLKPSRLEVFTIRYVYFLITYIKLRYGICYAFGINEPENCLEESLPITRQAPDGGSVPQPDPSVGEVVPLY